MMMPISRRLLLAGSLGGTVIPSFAQTVNSTSTGRTDGPTLDQRPFIELTNPITQDLNLVLTFFSFTCPFCRLQHEAIANWSSGLPTKWLRHEWVPLVTDRQTMTVAIIFYAARKQFPNPRDLRTFMSRAYAMVQDEKKPVTDARAWQALLNKPIDANEHKTDVLNAAKRLVDYQITNTPSISMAGRYVITPEIVNGRADMFIQLANGVASMALSSMGYTGR